MSSRSMKTETKTIASTQVLEPVWIVEWVLGQNQTLSCEDNYLDGCLTMVYGGNTFFIFKKILCLVPLGYIKLYWAVVWWILSSLYDFFILNVSELLGEATKKPFELKRLLLFYLRISEYALKRGEHAPLILRSCEERSEYIIPFSL